MLSIHVPNKFHLACFSPNFRAQQQKLIKSLKVRILHCTLYCNSKLPTEAFGDQPTMYYVTRRVWSLVPCVYRLFCMNREIVINGWKLYCYHGYQDYLNFINYFNVDCRFSYEQQFDQRFPLSFVWLSVLSIFN